MAINRTLPTELQTRQSVVNTREFVIRTKEEVIEGV
jgi:hypothetical protein